ncbi:MAG: amino acid adenylation domain-containing protein, partial [Cellvibrionales bacterium]|nr:amino acid adenylation domain-containing protein [Cellvibrionales bacterium]
RKVRKEVNQTFIPFDDKPLLHQTLMNSTLQYPDNIALRTIDKAWSYNSLLAWVQESARHLKEHSPHLNELVAVYLPKSAEQIVATLSVLFSGCTYVPISIDTPPVRVREIIDRCKIRYVFAQSNHSHLTENGTTEIPKIITIPDYSDSFQANLNVTFTQIPSDLAYIIFTSGTTGVPKGVSITHESAMNTILDINRRFNVSNKDSILGVSELNFDLSVYDIFGAFNAGATLIIPSQEYAKNPIHLSSLIENFQITVWNSVPAFLEMVVEYCEVRGLDCLKSLEKIYLSGDWIPIAFPNRIKKHSPNCRLISMGGATEASIWSNFHEVEEIPEDWTSIPYGKPLANQFFRVLDTKFRDSPAWVPGELYIGGAGLAQEYFGDPEKTEAQFIISPTTGERLYRTGDWGRYWPDGTLEFLGRRDTQVKIRGHRIELGDIEAAFSKLALVKEALALVYEGARSNIQHLVAFVTLKSEATPEAILEEVSELLPAYMIPSKLFVLEDLPLTANNKVDRKALIAIASNAKESKQNECPMSAIELLIVGVWKEIFGDIDLTQRDNFFELGGDSITAIRMLNSLSQKLGKPLPLSLAFDSPTLNSLAASVSKIAEKESKILIPLNSKANEDSIFCIHPVGGNIFCYRDLAELWNGKVWGIQSLGLNDGEEPVSTIKRMAADYANAINLQKTSGPIHLFGWSMGGMVALETARVLKQKNRRVSVVMLDTWVSRQDIAFELSDIRPIVSSFISDITNGELSLTLNNRDITKEEAIRKGNQLLKEKNPVFEMDDATLLRLFHVYQNNHKAIARHIPLT